MNPLTSYLLVSALLFSIGLAGALIRISTLSFALVVASEMLLGSLGLIRLLPHVVLFGGIYAASFLVPAPGRRQGLGVQGAPLMLLAALAPMVVFIVATGITQSPLTLYDSLSYHLVFPARWLLVHRLSSLNGVGTIESR